MHDLTFNRLAFGDVIPKRDDSRCADFGNHVMPTRHCYEKPHAKLIESQADDTRPDENCGLLGSLMTRAFENINDAQPIVENYRYREGNRRRVKVVNAGKFRQREE